MKLLLVTVTVIAVFTVDGRDFSNDPEGRDTANQAQLVPEDIVDQHEEQNSLDVSGGDNLAENLDSAHDDQQLMEERKEHHQRKLRRSRCKARNACVVMGGFCVTNATLCGGRLVPEGCKGTNCQCCVPGTIESRFDNLEMELQSLKDSMNNSNTNLNSELQSLKDSMDNTNSNLNSEIQSLKINMNNSDSNLGSELQSLNSNLNSKLNSMNTNFNTKLASLAENQGCPEGFFELSDQCFKFFTDTTRSWTASKSKCQSEGLVLAKPYDPLQLRSYLAMRYATKRAWVGARGTGSNVKWDRDGTSIGSSNPMWFSNHPSGRTSSSYCLALMSEERYMKSYPSTPYYSQTCSSTHIYALCEYLMD